MTIQQINDCFKSHINQFGLPGSVLENYIQSFKNFIERLNSYPDISITHLKLFDKNPDAENRFKTLENYHKIKIDDEIKSFYNQTDGLQLRWINRKHPRFNPEKDSKFYKKAFDMSLVDLDKGAARFINIFPSDLFLSDSNGSYLAFKKAEGYRLFYFNYNHFHSNQVAFNLDNNKHTLDLYYGQDYFSSIFPLEMNFSSYMQSLLNINDDIISQSAQD